MSDSAIVFIAVLESSEGRQTDFQEALQALVPASLSERGCLAYQLHLDQENPLRSMLYEVFASKADHAIHLELPHFVRFKDQK